MEQGMVERRGGGVKQDRKKIPIRGGERERRGRAGQEERICCKITEERKSTDWISSIESHVTFDHMHWSAHTFTNTCSRYLIKVFSAPI